MTKRQTPASTIYTQTHHATFDSTLSILFSLFISNFHFFSLHTQFHFTSLHFFQDPPTMATGSGTLNSSDTRHEEGIFSSRDFYGFHFFRRIGGAFSFREGGRVGGIKNKTFDAFCLLFCVQRRRNGGRKRPTSTYVYEYFTYLPNNPSVHFSSRYQLFV